ncbi:MAG: cell division protein FtsA [Candidatus Nephrothrix sp. EaCA]|nr:MAG: cell division protein FtsA [Candidatus Nephrothrix sp. EaCA]
MEHEKIVVGLDVGTTKICAVAGRMNEFGKLEILGVGIAESEGVVKGVIVNINKTAAAIEKAIRGINNFGIEVFKVNIGIAGHHINSSVHRNSITRESNDTEITGHDVDRLMQDMYRMLMPPGAKIIHVMPQFYSVDYEHGIKDPVGMSGVKLEADFHIISANVNAINNINKCVRHAQLECEDLILEPLASSLSVLSDEEREAGVCLVDIGGGTTDVAIFHDNVIRHTVVIPFGGNIITSDIQQGLMIMARQAEELKTRYGKAISDEASPNEMVLIPGIRQRDPKEISVKNLACIIQARMEEIIEMVHIQIIKSGFEKRLAGGIVLTGGGAQLSGLRQLAEYMTELDARIGFPNEHLGKSVIEDIKSPMYATAVGLVLAGFRSLDEREPRYRGKDSSQGKAKQDKKPSAGGSFFSGLLAKTKALLINDLNDKREY